MLKLIKYNKFVCTLLTFDYLFFFPSKLLLIMTNGDNKIEILDYSTTTKNLKSQKKNQIEISD
jgi:hypothetical protein